MQRTMAFCLEQRKIKEQPSPCSNLHGSYKKKSVVGLDGACSRGELIQESLFKRILYTMTLIWFLTINIDLFNDVNKFTMERVTILKSQFGEKKCTY